MAYAAEITTLRAPVMDNLSDFPTIIWETEGENVARLRTGDRANPGEYMLLRSEYAAGEYLASGGGNEVWKHADLDWRIAVEKAAGSRASARIAAYADSLVTRYNAASDGSAVFRTPEAMLTAEYQPAEGWIARDWVCPVWLFGSA